MMRRLLIAGLVGLAVVGVAVGQQLSSLTLNGNEVWVASIGGPGGSGTYLSTASIRNASGVQLQTATSGTVNANTLASRYIWTATVTGALALNTPAQPFDGQILEIVNGSGANNTGTITLTPAGGQTVVSGAVATLAQNTSVEWQYAQSTSTWYRMR